MSRTLNDFDDEDAPVPGGALDLETGGQVGGGAAASTYGGGSSLDLDDGFDDAPADLGAALELDLPGGARQHGPGSARGPGSASGPSGPLDPPGGSSGGVGAGQGGPAVPDLAFDAAPSSRKLAGGPSPQQHGQQATQAQHAMPAPPPSSSGALPARTSGAHPAARTSGAHPAAPPSSSPSGGFSAPPPSSSGGFAPHAGSAGPSSAPHSAPGSSPGPGPRTDAAAVIARYPVAPEQILGAPRYAVRVLLRQLELRTELESLRRRRSPDVKLYEAALRAYDPRTFKLGMAINCAALAVATFIFFLPVIIRFMRAD